MKKFLIAIVILASTGFLISTVKFATLGGKIHSDVIIFSVVLLVINSFCSTYLYRKANRSKVEWALFGFLGNFTAIVSFWLFRDVIINWKRGKRNFS